MFDQTKFKIAVLERGLTVDRIAIEIGVNPATLYRKMSGKSEFTRCELQNLRRILNLSAAQFEDIFFAQEVTDT